MNSRSKRSTLLALLALGISASAVFALPQAEKPSKSVQSAPAKPQTDEPPSTEKLPEADAILQRHIDAIGGEAAMKKHEYRTSKGDFSIPSVKITGTFEVKQAAPSFYLLTLVIPQIGTSKQGYNGEVAWSIDDNSGANLLEDAMLEQTKRDADFYSDLNYKTHFTRRETLNKEEFNKTECYKIRLVPPVGEAFEAFYSVDTGLLQGMQGVADTPYGKIRSISTLEEYKEVDGVKISHKITINYPDLQTLQVMTVKEISHEEVSRDIFALPKEIQTLVEIKASEKDDEDEPGDVDDPDDEEDDDDDEDGEDDEGAEFE